MNQTHGNGLWRQRCLSRRAVFPPAVDPPTALLPNLAATRRQVSPRLRSGNAIRASQPRGVDVSQLTKSVRNVTISIGHFEFPPRGLIHVL